MQEAYKNLIGKRCDLTLNTGFHLFGVVDGMNDYGCFFTTIQKSSWFAWSEIERIVPLENKVM